MNEATTPTVSSSCIRIGIVLWFATLQFISITELVSSLLWLDRRSERSRCNNDDYYQQRHCVDENDDENDSITGASDSSNNGNNSSNLITRIRGNTSAISKTTSLGFYPGDDDDESSSFIIKSNRKRTKKKKLHLNVFDFFSSTSSTSIHPTKSAKQSQQHHYVLVSISCIGFIVWFVTIILNLYSHRVLLLSSAMSSSIDMLYFVCLSFCCCILLLPKLSFYDATFLKQQQQAETSPRSLFNSSGTTRSCPEDQSLSFTNYMKELKGIVVLVWLGYTRYSRDDDANHMFFELYILIYFYEITTKTVCKLAAVNAIEVKQQQSDSIAQSVVLTLSSPIGSCIGWSIILYCSRQLGIDSDFSNSLNCIPTVCIVFFEMFVHSLLIRHIHPHERTLTSPIDDSAPNTSVNTVSSQQQLCKAIGIASLVLWFISYVVNSTLQNSSITTSVTIQVARIMTQYVWYCIIGIILALLQHQQVAHQQIFIKKNNSSDPLQNDSNEVTSTTNNNSNTTDPLQSRFIIGILLVLCIAMMILLHFIQSSSLLSTMLRNFTTTTTHCTILYVLVYVGLRVIYSFINSNIAKQQQQSTKSVSEQLRTVGQISLEMYIFSQYIWFQRHMNYDDGDVSTLYVSYLSFVASSKTELNTILSFIVLLVISFMAHASLRTIIRYSIAVATTVFEHDASASTTKTVDDAVTTTRQKKLLYYAHNLQNILVRPFMSIIGCILMIGLCHALFGSDDNMNFVVVPILGIVLGYIGSVSSADGSISTATATTESNNNHSESSTTALLLFAFPRIVSAMMIVIISIAWSYMSSDGIVYNQLGHLPSKCQRHVNYGHWYNAIPSACSGSSTYGMQQLNGDYAARSSTHSTKSIGTCNDALVWGWDSIESRNSGNYSNISTSGVELSQPQCQYNYRSPLMLQHHLHNRTVTVIGDSVLRHLYHALCRQMGDGTAGRYNTTMGKWSDFSRVYYDSIGFEFRWAPYVTNLTRSIETQLSIVKSKDTNETKPDLVILGGGAWDRLHRYSTSTEQDTVHTTIMQLQSLLAELINECNIPVVWVIPTSMNTWGLTSDAKRESIREDQMSTFRMNEYYKSIHSGVAFVLDGPAFTKERVEESYDGVHYPLSIYDGGAQILMNAFDWLLPVVPTITNLGSIREEITYYVSESNTATTMSSTFLLILCWFGLYLVLAAGGNNNRNSCDGRGIKNNNDNIL